MILSPEEIKDVVVRARRQGKKIVFTNGCFDILHKGHISLLSKAATFGDTLVIGLNSDDSVRRLKGETRPLQDWSSRAAVLDALKMVDYVIGFEEDTPLNLIETIEPDVLVKGGDYDAGEVVGAEVVRNRGGEVVIIPLEEGYSTSAIERKFGKGVDDR